MYNVDPQQATLRRTWSLLQRMPQGEWHKDNGPGSWSNESYLLASVIDAVNQNTWVTVAANSKRRPKQPKPIPRPGQQKAKPKMKWTDLAQAMSTTEGVTE